MLMCFIYLVVYMNGIPIPFGVYVLHISGRPTCDPTPTCDVTQVGVGMCEHLSFVLTSVSYNNLYSSAYKRLSVVI